MVVHVAVGHTLIAQHIVGTGAELAELCIETDLTAFTTGVYPQ